MHPKFISTGVIGDHHNFPISLKQIKALLDNLFSDTSAFKTAQYEGLRHDKVSASIRPFVINYHKTC